MNLTQTDILSRIEELGVEYAKKTDPLEWSICDIKYFIAGARAVLALLAEVPESGHPSRLEKFTYPGHKPPTDYCAISEVQSARAQDAQTMAALREDIEKLEMSLNAMGIDYGAELKKKDELYISAVKGRSDFRAAITAERARADLLAKRVGALEAALIDASDEFERIATLRQQIKPPQINSTHAIEKQIAIGAKCFAQAAKTEISRVLAIHHQALGSKAKGAE